MHIEPHQINLTRRWQAVDNASVEWPQTSIEVDAAGTNRWFDLTQFSVRESAGPIQLTRNFNCPTGLNADARCELVFENLPIATICHLNGQSLGTINDMTCRFEIAQSLQATNRILIELPSVGELTTNVKFAVRLELL